MRKLGDDIISAIQALKLYSTAGSPLCALHDLDILDKHEIAILPYGAAWMAMSLPEDLLKRLPKGRFSGAMVLVTEQDALFLRHGLEVLHLSEPQGLTLVFPEFKSKSSPLAGQPVVKTLRDLAQAVHEVVELFAAQFGGGKPFS